MGLFWIRDKTGIINCMEIYSVEKGGCKLITYCPKVVLLPVVFWNKSSATFDTKVVLLLVHFLSKSSTTFGPFLIQKYC